MRRFARRCDCQEDLVFMTPPEVSRSTAPVRAVDRLYANGLSKLGDGLAGLLSFRSAMVAQRWKRVRVRAAQLQSLQRQIEHACRTVPYYRELLSSAGVRHDDIRSVSDLQHIPITTSRIFGTRATTHASARHSVTRSYTCRAPAARVASRSRFTVSGAPSVGEAVSSCARLLRRAIAWETACSWSWSHRRASRPPGPVGANSDSSSQRSTCCVK